ncbi:hypothetical protein QJS04_geneDACA007007 [Acorus gramineus]|uniref:UBX domain-containing protein n=1 Tax=Acorus gramineus TaxID=55184 RepID=A0AAV9A2L6_ACOGR|nr:hypothetical protein QJS04_geneDACA007007 [Acorus gramineus]
MICRVCQKQFSQYTCPRCNCRYCSLPCYKRHSLRCSESFMQENVVEEMQMLRPEDETKRRMLEILKRFHSEEGMEEDRDSDSTLSEETIQKFLSGDEVYLEDLSPDEIKLFQRAVASGELSKLIEPWEPWWLNPSVKTLSLSQDGVRLIRPIQDPETSTSSPATTPEAQLPPLHKLINNEPSPLLPVHLVDVLYTYCFTLRHYNGDWHCDPAGACMDALTLSVVLGDSGQPETVLEAVSSCMECACSPAYRHAGGLHFRLGLIDDVVHLLSLGGAALVCSLCDMRRLIQSGREALKSERGRESKRAGGASKLKLAERKVYFMMCWVHEQPNEVWLSLAGVVGVEKAALEEGNKPVKRACEGVSLASKVLIEETIKKNNTISIPSQNPRFLHFKIQVVTMVDLGVSGYDDKLASFQAVTGIDDLDLCRDILSAHNWDLELAVSSYSSTISPDSVPAASNSPGLVWKIVTIPVSVISGGLGLIAGTINLGLWIAGGVISHSSRLLGFGAPADGRVDAPSSSSGRLITVSSAVTEAAAFIGDFEREFGRGPAFVAEGFIDALQRSKREYKMLFVYLHSPEHPDTPQFCSGSLCSEAVAAFLNENFVAWGGSIRSSEGFKMSNSFKASRFPFCAVVMATMAANDRVALVQQIEGPKSPEEMLSILQQVVEQTAPVLVTARVEAEERMYNLRLREEQDAAYRDALETDQARERQRKEEQERLEREAAEEERKREEEEELRRKAALEAAEKEAALARRRQEKAMSLGIEPEKGSNVTQVLVRFPNGERKGRRFDSSATVQSLYDYVDSLDCLDAESYTLVGSFPRVVYGPDKLTLTLMEAGLHPQASLFVEIVS